MVPSVCQNTWHQARARRYCPWYNGQRTVLLPKIHKFPQCSNSGVNTLCKKQMGQDSFHNIPEATKKTLYLLCWLLLCYFAINWSNRLLRRTFFFRFCNRGFGINLTQSCIHQFNVVPSAALQSLSVPPHPALTDSGVERVPVQASK